MGQHGEVTSQRSVAQSSEQPQENNVLKPKNHENIDEEEESKGGHRDPEQSVLLDSQRNQGEIVTEKKIGSVKF